MDRKLIWSEAAIEDLKSICDFIARENPEAAERIGRGLLGHVRILEAFPLIGPPYPRGARGSLRQIVYLSYRIFYDATESSRQVEVLHVRHGARDEPRF